MTLTLIINTYNNPVGLEKVFRSVAAQTQLPSEIVIADDGSGAETRAVIATWVSKLSCPVKHAWQKNEGFRRSMILNKAIAAATSDYIVFVDGDCPVHPKFVEDHKRLAERTCFVQGRRTFIREEAVADFLPNRFLSFALSGRTHGTAKGIRLPFPIVKRDQGQKGILGCNLAIWRADLIEVNGYDEEFIGWGREDTDLANRLYNIGRRRKLVHNWAVVYHLNHPPAARSNLQQNQQLLDASINAKRTRCAKGLDQHLTR